MHQSCLQEDSHRSLKQSRARKRTKQTNDRSTNEADPSVTVQKINAYEMIGKTQQSGKKMNRQGCRKAIRWEAAQRAGVLV